MTNVLEYLKTHLKKILGLALILGIEVVALVVFSHDRAAQKIIVILMAVTYGLWGITDHLLHHKANLFVILEYVLVATLAACGVIFVFGWSG